VTGVLSRGCHKSNWATLRLVEDTLGEADVIWGVLHVVLGARYDRQGDLSIKKGGKHAVLGWVGSGLHVLLELKAE